MIGDYSRSDQMLVPTYIDSVIANGGTVAAPATESLIVVFTLWPAADISSANVVLPTGYAPGQRVFVYADKAIGLLTVKTTESGVVVRNAIISVSEYDLYVFSRVSETIWARVTS